MSNGSIDILLYFDNYITLRFCNLTKFIIKLTKQYIVLFFKRRPVQHVFMLEVIFVYLLDICQIQICVKKMYKAQIVLNTLEATL